MFMDRKNTKEICAYFMRGLQKLWHSVWDKDLNRHKSLGNNNSFILKVNQLRNVFSVSSIDPKRNST